MSMQLSTKAVRDIKVGDTVLVMRCSFPLFDKVTDVTPFSEPDTVFIETRMAGLDLPPDALMIVLDAPLDNPAPAGV